MNELTAKLKEYIVTKYSAQADAILYAKHLKTYLKVTINQKTFFKPKTNETKNSLRISKSMNAS